MKGKYLFKLLMTIVLSLNALINYAAEEPYINSLRGTGVVQGASFDVTDEKFLSASTFYGSIRPAPYSVLPDNIVELKLNYDTSLHFYDKIFTATVNVTIKCYNNPFDTSQFYTQYSNVNLTIKYDTATGSPYKGIYFMKFSGAYKFRVIINSITCPELGTNMPPVLIVEGKTVVKRKYNFSPSSTDITKIEELPNQIRLNWIPANYPGAEWFDLEYTIVDDSSAAAASIRNSIATSIPLSQTFLDGLFRNNASRVVTSGSNYTVNQLYQAGYLLFRIRGVQFGNEYRSDLSAAEQNLRTEGNWNYQAQKLNQPSYQFNVVQLQWHEPNLNWQYNISFAEEGKRKEVIGYFDGILKSRQNVTLNNTDNKSVVQETIYDALGRPAISVLPVPTSENTIHYFQNFNRNKLEKSYSYKDFPFSGTCQTIPDTMSRSNGAHQYYSSNNNINDYFFKKYIPQAEGYPFAVTEYMPDNTGRIFAQGGVGKDFQPGTNHETKYFYSKPTQEELDRLFGSEAGNASHFLKNMVVDPNGQISVNYVNSSGKTVATALAGLSPTNLEPLKTNNGIGIDVIKNLLAPQDFTKDFGNNSLFGNASFLAEVSGNYKFKYNLTPLRLDVLHGPNNEYKICNTCYYDLVITVKDNCNQILATVNKPVDPNTIFQTDCNIVPSPIVDSFTLSINNVGEYNLSYVLKISETAFQFYDSVHLIQNTNIRTFNSFAIEKLNNADFKGCYSDCSTCLKELGTKTDFIENKIKPLFLADSLTYTSDYNIWAGLLYDSLYAYCSSLQAGCTIQAAPCDEEKELLLDDVRPGGQYSPYDSLFNPTELSINVMYSHRSSVMFYNEDGSIGTIEWNGQTYGANDPSIPWQVFIENFQDSWADALLPYHPEYCFYQWCIYGTNPASKAFDNEITDIEDDSTATAKGYFGAVTSLLTNDPFFSSSGYGYPYYSQMQDSLNLFSRTISGYSGPDLNISQYIDYELYCAESGIAPGSCTPNASCRSFYMEWTLYKEYYLNLKAYFYEKARLANPTFANCRNCYIGTDYTDVFTCTPPPTNDFSIQLDPTYTAGKRIIVKYKNAQSAVSNNLTLIINYNTGTITERFRQGRGTEMYIVPTSQGDYYAITSVQCDTSCSNCRTSSSTTKGGTQSTSTKLNYKVRVVDQSNATIVNNCPCPDPSMFSVFGTGNTCWDGSCEFLVSYNGPAIPNGRTVYVDVYWEDFNSGQSGVSTVYFSGNQTQSYGCAGGGFSAMRNATAETKPSKNKPSQLLNKKVAPTQDALNKAKAYKLKFKNKQPLSTNQSQVLPPPGGVCNLYLYVQNVYCYDDPSFVCPGDQMTSLCKDDPLYPLYKDKVRRYDTYQNPQALYQSLTANYNSIQSQGQSGLISEFQANCEAQADIWINALRKCTTDENVLATIKAQLIAVCQSGSDVNHPYGSSTNPSLSQSFESVIRQYIPNSSDSCTAELISDPYPYNRQPNFEGRTVLKIDNCLTTQYNQLKTQYQNSGYSGTFHQWLQKQLKSDYTLSEQQLNNLDATIANGCTYLKKPLNLPAALNCSSSPACADSATIVQLYSAFLIKYPGITSSNPNYETLLTNYFNHNLAFNLSYEDYITYIQKCQTGTTNKDLLCNLSQSSQVTTQEDVRKCMSDVFNLAIAQAVNEYTVYIDSVHAAFRNAYMMKCMNVQPSLTLSAKLYEYHYTLYYYDQSGSLVKTIPPEGSRLLSDAELAQVQNNRVNTNGYCYSNAPELQFNANIVTMPREYSYDPVIDGKYSLEAWLKLGSLNLTGPNGIFSYNAVISGTTEAGFALVQRNGKLAFIVGTTPKLQVETPLLSIFLSPNTWFHIAITVNNNSSQPVKMFINGNNVPLTYLNNYSPYYYVSSSYTHQLRIGGAFDNASLTAIANSGIKQFRWYQRELGIAEIQQNAFNNCLIPTSQTGLVSYIPVNEGSGNVMEDKVNYNVSTMDGNASAVWQNYVVGIYPKHQFPTTYQYNSYNQVMRQNSPDGGTTSFWYDALGRLVASQNAEQKTPKNVANNNPGRYSYTKYDAIGRMIDVGEKYTGGTLIYENEGGSYNTKDNASLNNWYNTGTDKQVTLTIYDQPNTTIVTNTTITNLQTDNSRKRVAASVYKELKTNNYYDYATHYVYDISGNVKTLFQDLKPMRDVELIIGNFRGIRQINYEYDLVSGKVNKVIYSPGQGDQFIYRYSYDANNRLTDAFSSRNGLQWQQDAHYYYYLHGPLARTEIGKYKVQGVDYAYTLQGWMKGINGQSLDATKDMAGDGDPNNSIFKTFGRDVYSYSIGYHGNDYKPIGGTTANSFDLTFTAPTGTIGTTGNTGSQLFNGNISNTTVALSKINSGQTTGYSYLYDQLNRILGTRQHSISGTSWNYSSYNSAYEEKVSYDANGNIKTYVRKGANVTGMPLAMDNLKYF